jgi:hypothetical protein
LNIDGFARIVRSAIYHEKLLQRSRNVVHRHGWFWPDTVSYETNFNGLVAEVDTEAPRQVSQLWDLGSSNGEALFYSLVELRRRAVADGETYQRNSQSASSQTQQNLNQSADRGNVALGVMRGIRDTSATVLFAGATVVTGGGAAALLAGTAAGLRFTARIQEGGRVGQAAIETGVDIVVYTITRGATMTMAPPPGVDPTTADRAAMAVLSVVINTAADLAKTAATGQEVRTPMQATGARIGVEAANALIANVLNVRGLPLIAVANLARNRDVRDAVVGALTGVAGDMIVDAARGNASPRATGSPALTPANTLSVADRALTDSSAFVRANVMYRTA